MTTRKSKRSLFKRLKQTVVHETVNPMETHAQYLDSFTHFKSKYDIRYKGKNEETIWSNLTEDMARIKKNTSSVNVYTSPAHLAELLAAISIGVEHVYEITPHLEQIVAVVNLLQGNVVEQKTGEGKTLVAVIAAVASAILDQPVHVITTNDYLAVRDGNMASQLATHFNIPVGIVREQMGAAEKRDMYSCPIVYSTHTAVGFDYLRDNIVHKKEQRVQNGLPFAIVDEVDNVLIDDARTPLIISNGLGLEEHSEKSTILKVTSVIKSLSKESVVIDKKYNSVSLKEQSILTVSHLLGIPEGETLFSVGYEKERHWVDQCLQAYFNKLEGVDYVVTPEMVNDLTGAVKPATIELIDASTGRIMEGRRYNNGLHTAIEAKHGLKLLPENRTRANISYQELFNLYDKLAGMTGTAHPEDDEFHDVYGLKIISIPTHLPVCRNDVQDHVFGSREDKFKALTVTVKSIQEKGQPVLVGTTSVEDSEYLSTLFTEAGIKHDVLNAVNHAREAEIIAGAGQVGAVTIATNMAGRGTDIKLSDEARKLGGLLVVGTNHNRSKRIDDQLRGRSGRQGDPGKSIFYTSLEDDLFKAFASNSAVRLLKGVLGKGDASNRVIDLNTAGYGTSRLKRTIRDLQSQSESFDSESRKTTFRFANVLSNYRSQFYAERDTILDEEDYHKLVDRIRTETISGNDNRLQTFVDDIYTTYTTKQGNVNAYIRKEFPKWSDDHVNTITQAFYAVLQRHKGMTSNDKSSKKVKRSHEQRCKQELLDCLYKTIHTNFEDQLTPAEDFIRDDIVRVLWLRTMDELYSEFLTAVDTIKQDASLRNYASQDTYATFMKLVEQAFDDLHYSLLSRVLMHMYLITFDNSSVAPEEPESAAETSSTSSTTKLVNQIFDNDHFSYKDGFTDKDASELVTLFDELVATGVASETSLNRSKRRQLKQQNGEEPKDLSKVADLDPDEMKKALLELANAHKLAVASKSIKETQEKAKQSVSRNTKKLRKQRKKRGK